MKKLKLKLQVANVEQDRTHQRSLTANIIDFPLGQDVPTQHIWTWDQSSISITRGNSGSSVRTSFRSEAVFCNANSLQTGTKNIVLKKKKINKLNPVGPSNPSQMHQPSEGTYLGAVTRSSESRKLNTYASQSNIWVRWLSTQCKLIITSQRLPRFWGSAAPATAG